MSTSTIPGPVDRIVAVEEHVMPDFLSEYMAIPRANLEANYWVAAERRLRDVAAERLADMDSHGVTMQILSATSPGIQIEPDARKATELATRTNDWMAAAIASAPDRFAGFATVALQDPNHAVRELKRAVVDLGMVGVLINGHTCGAYLDEPQFRDFLATVADLGVPLYLHPASSPDTCAWMTGHSELRGPIFGWGVETAAHFLRLLFSGVFDDDQTAGLTVMMGHAGEGLLAAPSRLDSRWKVANPARHGYHLEHLPSHYLRTNLFVTLSGVSDPMAFWAALAVVGPSRMGMALDYPMEDLEPQLRAMRSGWWTDELSRRADDQLVERVAWRNVSEILRLSPAADGDRGEGSYGRSRSTPEVHTIT